MSLLLLSIRVKKIPDEHLHAIPLGEIVQKIEPPPVFRPDDYFFHEYCEIDEGKPDKIVNDVGLIPNLGDFTRHISTVQRIEKTKRMQILALGGSITAGGYFEEFARRLRQLSHLDVTVYNHGHGATEITYTIFCVDIDKYEPDLVMIDFAVNDDGHPKLMEALIRKALSMKSKPIVLLANMWYDKTCPPPRYLLHSFYYKIPIINMCPAISLCFGKHHLPRWRAEEYSKTDGVHPWGPKGVPFIGAIFYSWWTRTIDVIKDLKGGSSLMSLEYNQMHMSQELPPQIYHNNPIGICTRCDALADDSDAKLTPLEEPIGFKVVTRMKIGYGGFNSNCDGVINNCDKNASTKSFKRSWQAEQPGSKISFKFYGTSVKVAMWQRRDGMGVLHATVDGDNKRVAKASGFFKGYTWAMERNNTGRSEIVPLFEGLEDKEHYITFVVSDEPANPWVKGHISQIFALLSASDNDKCKSIQLK